jgi:mercuric reductase
MDPIQRNDTDNWFDLTVVSDPFVHEVLENLLDEWRMKKRWNDLAQAHRRLHEAILLGYLKSGRAPARAQLSAWFTGPIEIALEDLVRRDLIVLDKGEVVGAYPFTSRPSRHKVSISGQEINAMCAIDALGAGAMAGHDAQLRSQCAFCGDAIDIGIINGGLSIDKVAPSKALVWAGLKEVAGCAADTQCRAILLFCDEQHLQEWQQAATSEDGYQLTPEQAMQAGAAIFRPFLTRAE